MPKYIKYPGSTFAVTLAAQLAVIPLIAFYFSRISIIGLVSNLIVVPLSGIITALGIILFFAAQLSETLGQIFGLVTYYLVHILRIFVNYFGSLPGGTIYIAKPSMFIIMSYYLLLFGIFQIKKYPPIKYILIAVFSAGVISLFAQSNKIHSRMSVTFLDSGNENIVFINFPNGKNILINAGDNKRLNAAQKIIFPYLHSIAVSHLDKIIIAKKDFKNFDAIRFITQNFKVSEIEYMNNRNIDVNWNNYNFTVTNNIAMVTKNQKPLFAVVPTKQKTKFLPQGFSENQTYITKEHGAIILEIEPNDVMNISTSR